MNKALTPSTKLEKRTAEAHEAIKEAIVTWAVTPEKKRRPKSLRSLAKDLGISKSYTSKILCQNKGEVLDQIRSIGALKIPEVLDSLVKSATEQNSTKAADTFLRFVGAKSESGAGHPQNPKTIWSLKVGLALFGPGHPLYNPELFAEVEEAKRKALPFSQEGTTESAANGTPIPSQSVALLEESNRLPADEKSGSAKPNDEVQDGDA